MTAGPPAAGCLVLLIDASGRTAADVPTGFGTLPAAAVAGYYADYLLDALAAAAPLPVELAVAAVGCRAGADGRAELVPLLAAADGGLVRLADLDPEAVPPRADGHPRRWTAAVDPAGDPAPAAGLAEAYRRVAAGRGGRADARPPVVVHLTGGAEAGPDYARVAASLGLLASPLGPPRLAHALLDPAGGEAGGELAGLSAAVAVPDADGAAGPPRPALAVNDFPLAEVWELLFAELAPPPPVEPAAGRLAVVRAFAAQKHGNAPAEWEDGYATDPAGGAAAVTDGATTGIFCRAWADRLARGFVADRPDLRDRAARGRWVSDCRAAWLDDIDYPNLRYTQQNKVNSTGGAATLLGLWAGPAGPDGAGRWEAAAVGDACLFWVRDGRLAGTFPLADGSHLNSTPPLVGTLRGADPAAVFAAGECRPGDLFLLATDATAGALFEAEAAGGPGWDALAALDDDGWRAWVDDRRADGRLKNDDCTLLVLRVEPAPAAAEDDDRPAAADDDRPAAEPDEVSGFASRDGELTPVSPTP